MLRLIPAVILCVALSAFGSHVITPPAALMAQADTPKLGFSIDWQNLFGTLGVTTVLVWYLYYTTAHAFPRTRKDFREEMDAERTHHEAMSDKATARVDKLCDELSELSRQLATRPCIMGREK
jgi:hypothetical protein